MNQSPLRLPLAWMLAAVCLVAGCATPGDRGGPRATVGTVVAGNLWSKRMEERRGLLERTTRGSNVEISQTADNQLRLAVPSDISFETGGYAVKAQLRGVLDALAATLAGERDARLRIVGHTDRTGSAAVNNPLSLDRAQSVRDYLAARSVAPTRVETVGRGDREPIADNASEAGRARNRRVEIFVREPG
ncbi:MAG: OmpA family protein [Caldimonas sp.]